MSTLGILMLDTKYFGDHHKTNQGTFWGMDNKHFFVNRSNIYTGDCVTIGQISPAYSFAHFMKICMSIYNHARNCKGANWLLFRIGGRRVLWSNF